MSLLTDMLRNEDFAINPMDPYRELSGSNKFPTVGGSTGTGGSAFTPSAPLNDVTGGGYDDITTPVDTGPASRPGDEPPLDPNYDWRDGLIWSDYHNAYYKISPSGKRQYFDANGNKIKGVPNQLPPTPDPGDGPASSVTVPGGINPDAPWFVPDGPGGTGSGLNDQPVYQPLDPKMPDWITLPNDVATGQAPDRASMPEMAQRTPPPPPTTSGPVPGIDAPPTGQVSGNPRDFAPHGKVLGQFGAPKAYGGLPRSTGPWGVPGAWYSGQAALASALRGQ